MAAILADLPESMTFDGDEYEVNRVSMSRTEFEQRRGEIVDAIRVVLSMQSSDFATLPTIGETIIYSGQTWRILDTAESPDGIDYRLFLGEEYAR